MAYNLPPGCTQQHIDDAFGDAPEIECPDCEESGLIPREVDDLTRWEWIKHFIFRRPTEQIKCSRCDGEGYIYKDDEQLKREQEEIRVDMQYDAMRDKQAEDWE